jgi:hypothetical protein
MGGGGMTERDLTPLLLDALGRRIDSQAAIGFAARSAGDRSETRRRITETTLSTAGRDWK